MKKLKTLDEHNAKNRQYQNFDFTSPILNGIECPMCKKELYDSNPSVTLTSMPAQKNIHCTNCEYVGYRIA